MKGHKIHTFPLFEDLRGGLTPFELDKNFPFDVKRVYLVTAKNNQTRGGHAHKIESELFIAAQGSIKAKIHDKNGEKIINLDAQNKGLEVSPNCWHEFYDFSENAVLLCFSSTHYLPGEDNYITNKETFLAQ